MIYVAAVLALCLLIGLGRAYASDTSVLRHWSQLIDGLEYSPHEFYASLEKALHAREIPGISISDVEVSKGAALVSAKRLYLRVKRGDVHFDVCAAPFGRGFFFSSWLVARPSVLRLSPIIGWVVALFSQSTYFRLDTAGMFQAAAHAAVLEVIDETTTAKGKELLTCRFIEEKRNLILVGRPSLGKTTVARAIGRAACQRLYSVFQAGMADLLGDLHAARADGTYRKAFRRVTQPDLLILDDAGLDTGLERDAANELSRVVCARYHQRSTIVVTNLPFKQWGTFLPSPAQAVAIADRLVDGASILRFSGRPFRVPKEILGAPLEGETQ